MNRILFEENELKNGLASIDDARSEHILNVLPGEIGQILKTGVVNGPVGTSTIVAIDGTRVTLQCNHDEKSIEPWADIILAPPRPRVMERLLPQLATMGVGKIILVGAKKVEKDFWGATLLKSDISREYFKDGLMQGGSSILPTLETRRNLRKFLDEELELRFTAGNRIIAHPYSRENISEKEAIRRATDDSRRLLLAIGPEGGWTDEEVSLFMKHGFNPVSLGRRILKTETAAIALLAIFGIGK